MEKNNKYSSSFSLSFNITVYLGNICRVEFIENEEDVIRIEAQGDATFIRYLNVEQEKDSLVVQVKNPCRSDTCWEPYDREGYEGENCIRVYLGNNDVNINTINYLNLNTLSYNNENGNYEVICSTDQVAIR